MVFMWRRYMPNTNWPSDAITRTNHWPAEGNETGSDARTAPAKTQHDHGDCCVFCAAGHGGSIAVDPPPLIFVSLQRHYQRVSWLEAADPMPTVRVGSNAQARAPPQLT